MSKTYDVEMLVSTIADTPKGKKRVKAGDKVTIKSKFLIHSKMAVEVVAEEPTKKQSKSIANKSSDDPITKR